jgi:hypothetical protein
MVEQRASRTRRRRRPKPFSLSFILLAVPACCVERSVFMCLGLGRTIENMHRGVGCEEGKRGGLSNKLQGWPCLRLSGLDENEMEEMGPSDHVHAKVL